MTGAIDTEEILSRFRQWLDETRTEAEQLDAAEEAGDLEGGRAAVGLFRLVEEFTALRQELKLQTRSARGLQEQAETMLPALKQAIERFDAIPTQEAEAARMAARPLVEALADLDEALERGREVIGTARRRLLEESPRRLRETLDGLYAAEPWWRRWACRRYYAVVRDVWFAEAGKLQREILDALVEGYGLIQARLRRTMLAEQLERIVCVGRAVDPHLMTVIEVVTSDGRPPGEVVEEVRPGYTWKGDVLRFAEVRASK